MYSVLYVCICVFLVQLPAFDTGAMDRVARAPAITCIEKTMAMHSEWLLNERGREGGREGRFICFFSCMYINPPPPPHSLPLSESYWRCLHHTGNLLHIPHAETREVEEADTVTALASLSMTGQRQRYIVIIIYYYIVWSICLTVHCMFAT